MSAMLATLLFAAAAAAAVPDHPKAPNPSVGARATATVSVRIVGGVRIAMSETQDPGLPAIQQSSIRAEGEVLRPARLVEFN